MSKRAFVSLAVAALVAASPAKADYVYVGDWWVGNGPQWDTNPAVYNALEVAALLFGGSPSDYAISTAGIDPTQINFQAHVDGWGDSQYLTGTVAQDYSLDLGDPGYATPGGGATAYSAYVLDHSCQNRYGNLQAQCAVTEPGHNFAFRNTDSAVPEPATWGMMLMGFGATGFALRRRGKKAKLATAAA